MIASSKRAYIDANILTSISLGEQEANSDARDVAAQVVADFKKGKYCIVVTNFVLGEVYKALKDILLADKIKSINSNRISEVIALINSPNFINNLSVAHTESYRNLISFVTSNKNIDVESTFSNFPSDLFSSSLKILNKINGNIRVYHLRCKRCEKKTVKCQICELSSEVKYKGANIQDILHMKLAQALKCDIFLTRDKGFEELKQEALPVKIQIM